MPIFGRTFFGHKSEIFRQIGLKFFHGGSGDNYLSIALEKFYFWFLGHFWQKNRRGHHASGCRGLRSIFTFFKLILTEENVRHQVKFFRIKKLFLQSYCTLKSRTYNIHTTIKLRVQTLITTPPKINFKNSSWSFWDGWLN